jgi:hypothetical protein
LKCVVSIKYCCDNGYLRRNSTCSLV